MTDEEIVAELTGHEVGCDCIECLGHLDIMAQDQAVDAEIERRMSKEDMD